MKILSGVNLKFQGVQFDNSNESFEIHMPDGTVIVLHSDYTWEAKEKFTSLEYSGKLENL